MMDAVNLLVTHQAPAEVARMIAHWSACVPFESIVLAYGGPDADFDAITFPRKFFVSDPRLRTRDHQRQLQSYTGIFRSALDLLTAAGLQTRHVHFAEYDHVPLVADLNARQIAHLEKEDADVLAFHLQRIDGTSHAHFLYHFSRPEFSAHWQRITKRRESEVVLSMLGTGSFWSYEAFRAIASAAEAVPCYMELYLPTAAHHLGFRVRDFGKQDQFVSHLGERSAELDSARAAGAWTLHPCKTLWSP